MTMANVEEKRTTQTSTEAGAPDAEGKRQRLKNNVRHLREDRLLSKAELAHKAGLSALTIDRVENGMPCRMNTKRKIILALGMKIEDKDQVFIANQDDGDE